MRTVVLDPDSQEMAELIERRRAIGADRFDEVWEGEYHMAPPLTAAHALLVDELAAVLRPFVQQAGLVGSGKFNLGQPDDYRVPDRALHRSAPSGMWVPTAALVAEVLSPHDESWKKLDFYARHGVEEVVIADPATSTLTWLARDDDGGGFTEVDRSDLLDVAVSDLAAEIDWPATD